jgi:magnesium transporter
MPNVNKDIQEYVEEIEAYLQGDYELSSWEIAKNLKAIRKQDNELYLQYLEKFSHDVLGEIVLELPEHYLKEIIENIPSVKLSEAIEELESDDATDLIQDIEEIDEGKAQEILSAIDIEDQEDIKKLKRYDEQEAGAYMQTELFKANYDEKVEDSIKRLRELKLQGELENIHQLFIVGSLDRLFFSIDLEDLITFDFNKIYRETIRENEEKYKPRYVRDDDNISEVVKLFEEYDLTVVPVVDYHGKLLGRITSDDIYDIIQERATEQIYKLAGVDDDAEHEDGMVEAGKSRLSWLFVNLFTAIIASSVIGLFDKVINMYVALAVLMPIVASMGGNAGTQTLTIMVRQLALGKIDYSNAKNAIQKEMILSIINGLFFAVVIGLIAYFWFQQPKIGFIIAVSMLINLLCAGFFGAMIPLLLKRLGIDPAVGSSVFLTTVTDVVGFLSFLGLATFFLT